MEDSEGVRSVIFLSCLYRLCVFSLGTNSFMFFYVLVLLPV